MMLEGEVTSTAEDVNKSVGVLRDKLEGLKEEIGFVGETWDEVLAWPENGPKAFQDMTGKA